MNKRILLGVILVAVFSIGILAPKTLRHAAEVPAHEASEDFRVVYVSSRPADEEDLLTPNSIRDLLGAEVVSSWQEGVQAIDNGSYDAVLLDMEFLGNLSQNALAETYKSNAVIVFFNAYSPTVELLTGDSCIGQDGWMDGSEEYASDFYLMVAISIQGNLEDVGLIEEQYACGVGNGDIKDVGGNASVYTSRVQNSISDREELKLFKKILMFEIMNMKREEIK